MPVVIYPPNLPLHEKVVLHREDQEEKWARPIPFIPTAIFTAGLFLAGIWLVAQAPSWHIASLTPNQAMLIASILPSIIIVAVILITPQLSAPIYHYQAALMEDDDSQIRWNLAVTATAHVYCGRQAQIEWINLLETLSVEDRRLALGLIKRVLSRLQQITVLTAGDWLVALCLCLVSLGVGFFFIKSQAIEVIFQSLTLAIMLQLFMVYLYVQRWQHLHYLRELEVIFEELTPAEPPPLEEAESADEVARWSKEQQQENWKPTRGYLPPSYQEAPPVPWEE